MTATSLHEQKFYVCYALTKKNGKYIIYQELSSSLCPLIHGFTKEQRRGNTETRKLNKGKYTYHDDGAKGLSLFRMRTHQVVHVDYFGSLYATICVFYYF